MPGFYVHRNAEQRLRDLVSGLRVVIVNGPRQSGKTTLLRMYQQQSAAAYVTLDDAFQLAQARDDPATFAGLGARPLIIDEVQRGGDDLIRAIKIIVDQSQDRGQFILSGSARFLTVPTLSESLAGRAGFLDLWPLSLDERTGGPTDFADRLFGDPSSLLASRPRIAMDARRLPGPGLRRVATPRSWTISASAVRRSWYDGYLNTVIVRDIGDFASLRDAEVIPKVLSLIAARAGSPMVHADIARDLAVRPDTVRNYLAYLDIVFLTTTVPAWSGNLTSKITKTPKMFVTDSGLDAYLLGATADALRTPRASSPGRAGGDLRAVRTRQAPDHQRPRLHHPSPA